MQPKMKEVMNRFNFRTPFGESGCVSADNAQSDHKTFTPCVTMSDKSPLLSFVIMFLPVLPSPLMGEGEGEGVE